MHREKRRARPHSPKPKRRRLRTLLYGSAVAVCAAGVAADGWGQLPLMNATPAHSATPSGTASRPLGELPGQPLFDLNPPLSGPGPRSHQPPGRAAASPAARPALPAALPADQTTNSADESPVSRIARRPAVAQQPAAGAIFNQVDRPDLYPAGRPPTSASRRDEVSAADPVPPKAPVPPKTIEARSVARRMLADARELAERGDVIRARQLARQAQRFPVKWEPSEESPQEFLERLEQLPEAAEGVTVTTTGSGQSKVIYPALGQDQLEAVRRLPSTDDAPARTGAHSEAFAPENGDSPESDSAVPRRSKILEFDPPVPFRRPAWATPPASSSKEAEHSTDGASPRDEASRSQGLGPAPGNPILITPLREEPAEPVQENAGPPLGRSAPPSRFPASAQAYRDFAFTSDAGVKIIDSREALRASRLDSVEGTRTASSESPVAPSRPVETTSFQTVAPAAASAPPQLLRIEANTARGDSTTTMESAFWLHQAPLFAFFIALLLCPMSLALCFAVVVKQLARHKGPIFQIQFAGGTPQGGPLAKRRRRRRREEEVEEDDWDDDWDDEADDAPDDERFRSVVRRVRQRPKRRGTNSPVQPSRRTAFVDPTSPDTPAHLLPPLPTGPNPREAAEQKRREQEQAIHRDVFEKNMQLREQLGRGEETSWESHDGPSPTAD